MESEPDLAASLQPSAAVDDGAQRLIPARIDEQAAIEAIAEGGMWIPTPDGGRIFLRYVRHEVFANGDWTWIGSAPAVLGHQSAVITFGKHAVFGAIPRLGGTPMRIETRAGRTWFAVRNPNWTGGTAASLSVRRGDARLPPRRAQSGPASRFVSAADAEAGGAPIAAGTGTVGAQSTSAGGPVVDVLIAYTQGEADALGGDANVLTRIHYLISYANQAYADSNVPLTVRLVRAVKVQYTDDNSNDTALDDLSGFDKNGNSHTVPAALSQIAALRQQYGADLVSLMRAFRYPVQDGCGLAWLIGGGLMPISSADAYAGYSVIGDGSNNGYYCEDKTLTHEFGHNMGLAHDRAHSTDDNGNLLYGAFPYSFGYKFTPAAGYGFGTIMAYEDSSQDAVQRFSSPDYLCDGFPCGLPDQDDNARALRQTAATIASFLPTRVPLKTAVHDDMNGDRKSDLFWLDTRTWRFSYWLMNGAIRTSSQIVSVASGAQFLAKGDFNGDGRTDVLWKVGGNLRLWTSTGSGFVDALVRPYPTGWTLLAAADVDGDGKADLLWRDGSGTRVSRWIMSGSTLVASSVQSVSGSWEFETVGDVDGDGKADVIWKSGSSMELWSNTGSSFVAQYVRPFPTGVWKIVGSADIDGDGSADLVWRDETNQRVSFWLMSGTTLVRSWIQPLRSVWRFGAIGDYDGDGKADLVWFSDSSVVLWTRVSTDITGQAIDRYPSGWELLEL